MSSPYVYYRMDSPEDLKRGPSCTVRELDWHQDLDIIRRFYARFTSASIQPDEFEEAVGNPLAIVAEDEIISFAAPLSFREGETEIGAVATVPERRNEGWCKAVISEMASGILNQGKAVTLTTDRNNLPMRAAAEAIGMREIPH